MADIDGKRFEGELPRSKGLVKLEDGTWRHYSLGKEHLVWRSVPDDGAVEAGERFELVPNGVPSVLASPLRNSTVYHGWPAKGACDAVVRISGVAGTDLNRTRERSRERIPQTRLRRFYEFLRENDEDAVQLALLTRSVRTASDSLCSMFAESFVHFDHFENLKDDFAGKMTPPNASHNFADRLVAEMHAAGHWAPPDHAELGFKWVGREMNPRRTKDSTFDDYRPATSSGAGGIDVLLQADDGGIPIVGEIKAATDTNAFLALVQALTYASELVTLPQRRRLENFYALQFESSQLSGRERDLCDIYLFIEDKTTDTYIEDTMQVATDLLAERNSLLARCIRRIVFLRTPPDGHLSDLQLLG